MPFQGEWRAWLDCPGGELPFWLHLRSDKDRAWGYILNGEEVVWIPELRIEGETVLIDFPHYDSRIKAKLTRDGTRLNGEWTKQSRRRGDHIDALPCSLGTVRQVREVCPGSSFREDANGILCGRSMGRSFFERGRSRRRSVQGSVEWKRALGHVPDNYGRLPLSRWGLGWARG